MTEDDTFSRLKRISFTEMRSYFLNWVTDNRNIFNQSEEEYMKERNKFFEKHNWTYKEYRKFRNSQLNIYE
jgi:hypothetical protein